MYPGKQRTVQLLIQHGFGSHVKDPLSAGRMQFQVKIFLPDKQSIQDQLTKNKYVYQIKLKHQGMISTNRSFSIWAKMADIMADIWQKDVNVALEYRFESKDSTYIISSCS